MEKVYLVLEAFGPRNLKWHILIFLVRTKLQQVNSLQTKFRETIYNENLGKTIYNQNLGKAIYNSYF